MPTPGKNETHDDFISRCIPIVIHDNTAKDPAQATAICNSIWDEAKKKSLIKANSLNSTAKSWASSQISGGHVNKSGSWSFSADDGNALLGPNGDDWTNYGKHHLGVDTGEPEKTKAHYKYPFAKGDTVYREGLIAVRQRAGQQNDDGIFNAAGSLINQIDGKAMRKQSDAETSLIPDPASETHEQWMARCQADGASSEMCQQMWDDEAEEMVMPGGSQMMAARKPVQRAYSLFNIKAVKEDERFISGIATTPTPDRAGDVIEPLGVKFNNPLPLLWQHDTLQPVGHAKLGRPTKDGITFEASIPKVSDPGKLKDRLDEVWQSIKIGLVKGVSIGFRSLEMSFIKDGGIRFIESEILELSLVTVPANNQATIQAIKGFDLYPQAEKHAEGAAKNRVLSFHSKGKTSMTKSMTLAEQISAFEAKRAAHVGRMDDLMKKAADAQVTLDDAESVEYDDLSADVKKIDVHLKRLADLESTNRIEAKPVNGGSHDQAVDSRNGSSRNPIISVKANLPPATSFIRYAIAMAACNGNRFEGANMARKRWGDQTPEVADWFECDINELMRQKAAVGSGTTTDATWASPLIAYTIAVDQFIVLLRPATIIGRIPGLRMVPFNIQMPRTTAGTSMGWVGENAPKPVSNMSFDTVQLRWAKAAGIILLTQELVRFSNPAAETVVRGDMIAAMAQFLDRQFVDPTVAAVTNVSPASITNGVTAVTRTGTNQAAFVTDATTLLNTFLTNNLSTAGGVWIMSQRQALSFSLMLNALGQPFYPNITAEGGTLLGYPVIASENVPSVGGSPADGTPIIFLLPREIMLADDGQVVIDASNQASVQMDTAPDSPPTASSPYVSLWQMNYVGLRAERWINWLKRRSTAVGYISNANYA